jgi:hypothetical protein
MTTIATGDIPTNITTLERHFLHAAWALEATIAGATFNLDNAEGSRTLYVTTDEGFVSPARERMVRVLAYIPIDPNWRSDTTTTRLWNFAKEISNNPYPAGFRP